MIRINDLYACIQGEGVQAGVPMVLARLQGCPVGCPFCDTKETWSAAPGDRSDSLAAALGTNPRWAEADEAALAAEARGRWPRLAWCLVTGGEPATQSLAALVAALKAEGFRAAVETSGTALGHVGAGFDWVCVSPKIGMPGGMPILPAAIGPADELKFVVGKRTDVEAIDAFLAEFPRRPAAAISLQPMSQSPKATDLCLETALSRGWRLSIQAHKYLGLR